MTGGPTPIGPAYHQGLPPPLPGERPQQVTIAGFGILAMTALFLVSGGLYLAALKFNLSFANLGVGVGAYYLILAAGFTALAIGIQRGREGARITAFVILGLTLLCQPFSLINTNESAIMYESWYPPISVVLGLLQIIVLIGTIVLLALPVSTAWFRASNQARKAGLLR